MGSRHIEALCDNPNCKILALCDVVKTRYTQMQGIVELKTGKKPDVYQDFRKVLSGRISTRCSCRRRITGIH